MLHKADIHLAIAFDQNYLNPFYALIASVFINMRNSIIIVHAIVSGLSESERKRVSTYVNKNGGTIHFYNIEEDVVKKFIVTDNWTSAVYYRLYFPLLVPKSVKRLLYLDTDTLVLGDLAEFYCVNMEHYPVAAVYDNWVKTAPQLGIYHEGDYFNSGVLLIDLERWNEQKISEQAFEFLQTFPEKIKFVDQDALNAVLLNNWKKLNIKYNFMYSQIPEGISQKALEQLIIGKVILHFTLQRPWHMLCKNRFRRHYFIYLRKSPAAEKSKIVDFKFSKIPQYLKLRIVEMYFDAPVVQRVWKAIKGVQPFLL
jgi:lipopolysaccharide biosynthesis glycosyltransferase